MIRNTMTKQDALLSLGFTKITYEYFLYEKRMKDRTLFVEGNAVFLHRPHAHRYDRLFIRFKNNEELEIAAIYQGLRPLDRAP